MVAAQVGLEAQPPGGRPPPPAAPWPSAARPRSWGRSAPGGPASPPAGRGRGRTPPRSRPASSAPPAASPGGPAGGRGRRRRSASSRQRVNSSSNWSTTTQPGRRLAGRPAARALPRRPGAALARAASSCAWGAAPGRTWRRRSPGSRSRQGRHQPGQDHRRLAAPGGAQHGQEGVRVQALPQPLHQGLAPEEERPILGAEGLQAPEGAAGVVGRRALAQGQGPEGQVERLQADARRPSARRPPAPRRAAGARASGGTCCPPAQDGEPPRRLRPQLLQQHRGPLGQQRLQAVEAVADLGRGEGLGRSQRRIEEGQARPAG